MGKYYRNIFYYAHDFNPVIYVCIVAIAVAVFCLVKGSKTRKVAAALLTTYACFILAYTVFAGLKIFMCNKPRHNPTNGKTGTYSVNKTMKYCQY